MILGIDASAAGSGGAKRHLTEILACFNQERHGFEKIIIWGVKEFLEKLPEQDNITKITDTWLNKGAAGRIFWQLFVRDRAFKNKFDVLFSPFGTYTGRITPYVTMSRNMLIFDSRERRRFGFSLMRLKFKILFFAQSKSFKNAQAIIFLSKYAKDSIEGQVDLTGIKKKIINHGISYSFVSEPKPQEAITSYSFERPFCFLYVSDIWVYKHPWNVIQAIFNLRKKGYPVSLTLVGNSPQRSAAIKLENIIQRLDPGGAFLSWRKGVSQYEVANFYHAADGFVFASTCENMPNILLEAMASGLPIACSSYGPMPEFLKEGGVYMDPEKISDIETVLVKMIHSAELRERISAISYNESQNFNWNKCANETFSFLYEVVNNK